MLTIFTSSLSLYIVSLHQICLFSLNSLRKSAIRRFSIYIERRFMGIMWIKLNMFFPSYLINRVRSPAYTCLYALQESSNRINALYTYILCIYIYIYVCLFASLVVEVSLFVLIIKFGCLFHFACRNQSRSSSSVLIALFY